jgi:23S rRNA A2030 N6-methylase RlmJ
MATDGRVTLLAKDGFEGLVKAMPPPSRRCLVLMDPPYEVKTDYETRSRRVEARCRAVSGRRVCPVVSLA